MKDVIILGASGNITKHVIDILVNKEDINLTLFLRNARRLRINDASKCRIVEGDVLDFNQLKEAIKNGKLIIQIKTAGDGGVAVYGKSFGRYPLDPSLVMKKK